MLEEQKFLFELYTAQNTIIEEKNYLEILKGYCENNLENSEDLNKIYPLISMICDTHQNVSNKIREIISFL